MAGPRTHSTRTPSFKNRAYIVDTRTVGFLICSNIIRVMLRLSIDPNYHLIIRSIVASYVGIARPFAGNQTARTVVTVRR